MFTTLAATLRARWPGLAWLARLGQARALRRQRARLAGLDGHLLRDIGLTREAALAEAQRPFWDVPPHWRGQAGPGRNS